MSPRKMIIIVAVIFAAITIMSLLYHLLVFRMVQISPSSNEFPSFAKSIDFYYSHPVASVESVKLNGSPVSGELTVDGNRVRYTHPDTFQSDTRNTVSLEGVAAKNGQKVNTSFSFVPKYINFNDLPAEVQKQSIERSSSGQEDDPFFNNYFPIVKDGYELEYSQHPTTLDVSLYVTFLAEVYNYDTGEQNYLPEQEAEKMRAKVFDDIRSMGGKPEDYDIHYSNPYLEKKYNPETEGHPDR